MFNEHISLLGEDKGKISDGYHTFKELYTHRHMLFIALCNMLELHPHSALMPWKSKVESDRSTSDDWFIAGIVNGKQQISYHLPIGMWNLLHVTALDIAPLWDGHSSYEVLGRLHSWFVSEGEKNEPKL